VTVSWVEPLLDRCRVTALDVGQGQAILLQSGGKTFLVDCGGDYSEDSADITADALLSQGIGRLDGIILTHYDEDHSGGLTYLLERIETDLLLLPYIEDEQKVGSALAQQAGERACFVSEDLEITYDSAKISVFAPLIFDSDNESCISILFQTENCDILITGDMGRELELRLMEKHPLPELELLIAGHHGSRHSTCKELLAATTPECVFISVGADNAYGHPHQEVLDRLEAYDCRVYRTDQNGTIIFRR
jgi:competence protein ComEC